ncbi:MAG TPA: hypothetical protein PKY59_07235 [Pyrinomonadaceae bacterium]|nr:hypothetical protein [Pyrinomonadaceae bacterium]
MENYSNKTPNQNEKAELSREEMEKLFNYPSIGELFSEADPRRLNDFFARLSATRENLERVIRYGNRDEAERASKAANAVSVTLEFLQNLQKMRLEAKR